MDKTQLEDEIGSLWSRFTVLAERADREVRRNGGSPFADTSLALADLSDQLEKFEATWTKATATKGDGASLRHLGDTGRLVLNGTAYEYETNTAEHARFLKALRTGMRGYSEAEVSRVKLADHEQLTDQMKAMSQADDTTGGYGASGEFTNDVLRVMSDISPVRQVARVIPVGAATGALIPIRGTVQTAKRISEVATRVQTTADLAFRLESVPVHEMYADTAVSRFLLSDSKYDLGAELLDAFTNAARLLEGKEFITGTGNGEMVGLDNASLPAGNILACADSSGHTVSLDDVSKLIFATVKAAYLPGARLLMNPKLYGALRMTKGTSSAPSYNIPPSDGGQALFGIPVVLMPDLPDNATPAAGRNVAYLINPLAYALVVRQEIVVQRLSEVYAEQGKVAFYLWQRVGGQPVIEEAIARLTTA